MAFIYYKSADKTSQFAIAKMLKDPDGLVQSFARSAIEEIKPTDQEVVRKIREYSPNFNMPWLR